MNNAFQLHGCPIWLIKTDSVPAEDDLTTKGALHDVETLLEIINMEPVRYYGIKVYPSDYHLLHLVPGFPHLPSIDTLQRYSPENNITPWHFEVGRKNSKKRNA